LRLQILQAPHWDLAGVLHAFLFLWKLSFYLSHCTHTRQAARLKCKEQKCQQHFSDRFTWMRVKQDYHVYSHEKPCIFSRLTGSCILRLSFRFQGHTILFLNLVPNEHRKCISFYHHKLVLDLYTRFSLILLLSLWQDTK
jgi:hypothetical protein